MSINYIPSEKLYKTAKKKLKRANTVLDIGCGINPQSLVKAKINICCEPFNQYVKVLQDKLKNKKNYVVMNVGWNQVVKIFPPKSIDTILLVDVIEHLEKEEGRELLKATELVASQQIAIFTPLGFLPQEHPDGKDIWGYDGGSYQEHKSGWLPEDFDESWDLYISEDYHKTDNMERPLDPPFGAIWAIKNFKC
ncbi:hypothetical protein [Methanolobus sp. WCC5]|uniref:hypothetical protein n=1 Tax=Methanolobus sp. WCC5 TaxID=3125785 RepID=UPI003250E808